MNDANGRSIRWPGELTTLPPDHEESRGHEREERASREGGPSEPTEVETDDAGPLAVFSKQR